MNSLRNSIFTTTEAMLAKTSLVLLELALLVLRRPKDIFAQPISVSLRKRIAQGVQ